MPSNRLNCIPVKFVPFASLAVSEKGKSDFHFFRSIIIKHILDSVIVISRIIKISVRVISLTSTLIILDIIHAIIVFTCVK